MARDHGEHCEQLAQMMQVIMRMAREKRTVDDTSSMNTIARTQGVSEGLMNPSANFVILDVGTSHYPIPLLTNVHLEICPLPPAPMPLERVYTYPYMPLPIVLSPTIAQVDGNLETIFP